MLLTLIATRVYGTASQYGSEPRTAPLGSPIVLDNFPSTKERAVITLGEEPKWPDREIQMSRAVGARIFYIGGANPETDLQSIRDTQVVSALSSPRPDLYAAIDEAFAQGSYREPRRSPYPPYEPFFNWYVTISIERRVEVDDGKISDTKYYWLDARTAIALEREFLAEVGRQIDVLATYTSVVVGASFLDQVVASERIVFSAPGREPFILPSMSGGKATIHIREKVDLPLETLDIDLLQRLLQAGADLSQAALGRRRSLMRLVSLYLAALGERDFFKRFLLSFFALELLTNRFYTERFEDVVPHLEMKVSGRPDSINVPVPRSLVWKPENLNFPLETKFAIVALSLCPYTAVADAEKFGRVNRARNDLAHRGSLETDDSLNADIGDLLERYTASALRKLLHP